MFVRLATVAVCIVMMSGDLMSQVDTSDWDSWNDWEWFGKEEISSHSEFPVSVSQLRERFSQISCNDVDGNGITEAYSIKSLDSTLDRALFFDMDEDGQLDLLRLAEGTEYSNSFFGWEVLKRKHSATGVICPEGRKYRIRTVASGELGAGAALGVATFQLEDVSNDESAFITFIGIGLGAGFKHGSGGGPGNWCEFETSQEMGIKEFESFGRITSAGGGVGIGAGYLALSFYPTDHKYVYVKRAGLGLGLGLGVSTLGGWWEIRD